MQSPTLPPCPAGYAERMPPQPEATTRVSIGRNGAGQDVQLSPPAADAWRQLHAAAAKDGITLQPLSGFRSVARQTEIVTAKLAAGQSWEAILRVSAYPGHSEHHTGRALDIGTSDSPPLEEAFAATPAFVWLQQHAAAFGFTLSYPAGNPAGVIFEPWHWCFDRR